MSPENEDESATRLSKTSGNSLIDDRGSPIDPRDSRLRDNASPVRCIRCCLSVARRFYFSSEQPQNYPEFPSKPKFTVTFTRHSPLD